MSFIDFLRHYFYPSHSNNHKAKLLHPTTLSIISSILILLRIGLDNLPKTGVKILGYAANISTQEIIRLTNEKRVQAGVSALNYSPQLSQAAFLKANHMFANQYWAHIAPDGTEPWKFFTDVGYRFRYAGENLARDFSNPQSIVDAWMSSASHRENLLSPRYTDIGVAVVEGGLNGVDTTIVVQFFGSPLGVEPKPVSAQAKSVSPTPIPTVTATPKPEEGAIVVTPTLAVPQDVDKQMSDESSLTADQSLSSTLPPIQAQSSRFNTLISPFTTTRGIAIALTSFLVVVFLIDLVIVLRNRIPRRNSKTFAHIAFLLMILSMAILAKVGQTL
jgi:uncharacterized protein YkwD